MTHRMILHDSLPCVAQMLIEGWGLKAVRRQERNFAASFLRMLLGCEKESGPKSVPSFGLTDPEVGDVAATSPRVAADSRSDGARFIPLRAGKGLSVEVARRLRVELVDSVG